jgi:hypothetical protein
MSICLSQHNACFNFDCIASCANTLRDGSACGWRIGQDIEHDEVMDGAVVTVDVTVTPAAVSLRA